MALEFSQIPLGSLPVGTILTAPIFDVDADRTKLLGRGIEINEQFLKQLTSRGISSVSVSKRDLAALSAGSPQGIARKTGDHQYRRSTLSSRNSDALDQDIADTAGSTDIGTVVDRLDDDPRQDSYDKDAVKDEIKKREQQIAFVEDLFVRLVEGDGAGTESLGNICRDSIQSIVNDKDLFLCLGINPFDSDYPSRHSLHVASVAISIGVMLGLDDQSLIDLGTGCLIHDVGMLKLDQRLYRANRQLTSNELETLGQHPILTIDALACPGVQLTRISRIVAYQIHERCDGSGYPRGATSDDLHILSRLAAVADAYVGLSSNRWHRRGLLPYYAMEKMLTAVREGLFCPKAVRGLLNAVSLFPLGSYIETNDGRVARVVRATGETYTQPIVEFWNESRGGFEPELLNLTTESTIEIRRAIPSPF